MTNRRFLPLVLMAALLLPGAGAEIVARVILPRKARQRAVYLGNVGEDEGAFSLPVLRAVKGNETAETTMLLRNRVILACTATMLSPAAMAQEKWHSVAEGSGVSVEFGVPGNGESVVFQANCEKRGAPIQFWYLSDQSTLPRQSTRRDGTRAEVGGVKIVVEVDNISHQYAGRGKPEELYGGHEIVWSAPAQDALFKRLSQGRSVTFVIGSKREKPISLKGSLPHLQKLQEKCST